MWAHRHRHTNSSSPDERLYRLHTYFAVSVTRITITVRLGYISPEWWCWWWSSEKLMGDITVWSSQLPQEMVSLSGTPLTGKYFTTCRLLCFWCVLTWFPKGGPNVTTEGFLTASQFASDDYDWLAHLEVFRHATANLYTILATIG